MNIKVPCKKCHKGEINTVSITSQTETYIHILRGCQVCGFTPKSVHDVHSTIDNTQLNQEEVSKFLI